MVRLKATRPTWQGYLRLSLVSCLVALYTATSRTGEVHFNMLSKETHNRIKMIPTDPETGPVDRADIVKGYEIEKGHYVVITDEEIKSVRLVMHQRERLMALEPRDKGILAYTIRNQREVRQADEIFSHIKAAKPPEQMIDIATKIIDQLEGPFDPSQFTDRYEEALRALIKEKEKGHTVTAPEQPKEAEVIDLMEALKRSLGQPGGARRKP